MARTSTSTTGQSTATSSASGRSSAPLMTASTTSRPSTASAIATRSTERGSSMPDGTAISALAPPAVSQQKRFRSRWVSPLLRRILLVNALPLALLVAALLYLDQYQNGLLEAEVAALREQARIY